MTLPELPPGSYWSEEEERYIMPSEISWSPKRYSEISGQDFGDCMCGKPPQFVITTTVHSINGEFDSQQKLLTICVDCAKAAGVFAKKQFGEGVEEDEEETIPAPALPAAESPPVPTPAPEPPTVEPEPEVAPEPEPEEPEEPPEPEAEEEASEPEVEEEKPETEPGFVQVKGSGEPLKKNEL